MKKLMIKQILKFVFGCLFSLLLFNRNTFAQRLNFIDCGTPLSPSYGTPTTFFGGNLKPERSDLTLGMPAPPGSYFPIMIVFVQFADEPDSSISWPIGGAPTFMNEMLSFDKVSRADWWNSYNPNTQTLTSWWQEASRGKLHALGKAYSIVLDHTSAWYASYGDEGTVNFDVYEKLRQNSTIDWPYYDKWRKVEGQWKYESDQKVDMIYMVHRRTFSGGPLGLYEGYVPLGFANGQVEYEVDPVNHIKINGSLDENGSGIKILGKFGVADKNLIMRVAGQEHGHYLFGTAHIAYAKMAAGPGSEYFYSPWEEIKLGYMIPTTVNFNDFNYEYTLGDYSSRGPGNGNIIQVPISDDGQEFFLIANRRKVSQHDRIANGDTLAYGNANLSSTIDYGKGTYIYHVFDGYTYPTQNTINNDLECADGLFNWQQTGLDAPDWELTNPWLPVLEPLSVSYSNDNGANGMSAKDGMDVYSFKAKWFSKGKKEIGFKNGGINRTWTNLKQNWTSRDLDGDRYDAWKPGYNEIFSPYSSPSTRDKNDINTGIFIWNNSINANTNYASYKILKVSPSYSEDQILQWTPPSRPMGIKIEDYQSVYHCYPKIVWNHNGEPDMIRSGNVKRYKVYKATEVDLVRVPTNYSLLVTLDIDVSSIPSYTDLSVYKYDCSTPGPPPNGTQYAVRYYVKAVDKYDDESVPSDFASTVGVTNGVFEPIDPDKLISENNSLPKEFSLKQNYPNPFNPSTNIQFDLPIDNLVSIKIYDIQGKEIYTLVNEYKKAGSYLISFNGSSFSSGIYYYKITAGDYSLIRKMMLIK